jgi:uncharacterized protein with PQ loop repeat
MLYSVYAYTYIYMNEHLTLRIYTYTSYPSPLNNWTNLILKFIKSVKKQLAINGDVAYH